MKIAVVEKSRVGYSDPYAEYFDFDYDRFQLTSSNKTKILKKDITLNESFDDYDLVVLIGKDPCRFIGKINNVTKYAGHIVNEKYVPMVNPIAIKFNPGLKDTIQGALTKLHAHINGTYEEVVGKYQGITCASLAKEYLEKVLREAKDVIVDIETTSLYPREGYVLGIAMTYEINKGVYIESDCIEGEIEDLFQQIFNTKNIIFHNAKFDIKWLEYHFNFTFPKFKDTMLEHYILNENEAHDLKSLAMKYTRMGEYDFELEEFKKQYMRSHGIRVADFSYEYIPFDIIWKYAAADADATIRLHKKFNPIVEKHFKNLYENILIRGTRFLIDIEEIGVPFSKSHLNEANETFTQQIFDLTEKLYKFQEVKDLEQDLGIKFNPNSTPQLRKLFYEKLNLPITKKTPKGEASTDKFVLEELSKIHPIPELISQIRQKVKLRSTYITKVLNGMDYDGRLRAGFHLHTVTSGRLSSSGKLNMQQLPRDDKTVKNCIRPSDPDWVIFSQDLTTAEMYYAAVLSGDKNLAQVFRNGEDFHSSIAKMTFGLQCATEDIAEKYPDLRQACKAISFGILYGAGPAKIASEANISFKEAKNIIDRYFGKFNKLKVWIDNTQSEILTNGYTYSAFGRKRRVPDVFSVDDGTQGHAMRSAMNFKVQSVASDVNLLIAMDAHDYIKQKRIPAEIFGLVHDSILGQCHKGHVDQVRQLLLVATQKDRGVSIPQCPIGVEFGYGESYAKAG